MDDKFLSAVASALVASVPNMPKDPRRFKPGELCQTLNSTPLGNVITDRKLRAHRERGGLRIGDTKTVDLFRYAAWLHDEHLSFSPQATPVATKDVPTAADKHRDRMARKSREEFESVAEIGDIPAVVNPERRARAEADLQFFLETYFPNSTGLSPFSEDHEQVIEYLQRCATDGGRFINCVYRGFAKTTIGLNTAIWAVITGRRRYVVVFGAEAGIAAANIAAIKMELSENDLLYEDFPEICHAIRALEGKPQRCASQTHEGELTHIGWRADQVVLPTIPGSKASGAILCCRGIGGSGTRGLNHRMPNGTAQRPDFVILDDLQTDKSAISPHQVRALLSTIKKSVLKLGGFNRKIACVLNATVLAADDAVEQLLDPVRSKAWQGVRIKMVRSWATAHETLWLDEYAKIRNTFDREDVDDQLRAQAEATQFYIDHQNEMDAGCVVSWAGCFDPECEVSAIQHAYNMLIDDGADVFATECQVEPPKNEQVTDARIATKEIIKRLNGFDRYAFPAECQYLTTYIDVQDELLYFGVCAWAINFTGYVIDYGTFPDQNRRYFTLNDASQTLTRAYPHIGTREGRWLAGLTDLVTKLTGRQWKREDGTVLSLGQVLIDASYGNSTRTIKRFCQTSVSKSILMPANGYGITASKEPMANWPVKEGERRGFNWLVRPDREAQGLRHVLIDSNSWKSFVHSRLAGAVGEPSSLTLWGHDGQVHEMLADQLTSEAPVRTAGRNRTLDEWKLPPNKPDNHLLDVISGCAVAASMLGCHLPEHGPAIIRRPRRKFELKV